MRGRAIIDTESEPGAYACALTCPPWIEDGDGRLFNEAFQLSKFAPDGHPQGDRFPGPCPFHHDQPDSAEEAQEHGA